MNETLEKILSRRSVRNFKPDQIKEEELQAILEAGKFAPSAMNQQSRHFIVIQNVDVLNKVKEATRAAFLNSGIERYEAIAKGESFNPYYNAPTLIIVFGDEKAYFPQHDGTLALGNMLLAAHASGVGACWIHAVNMLFSSEEGKALRAELSVPEGYVSVGSAVLGYNAGETPKAAPRKEGTVNIIR